MINGITIQADKTRMLRFNINAMIEYKKMRGEDIIKAFSRLEKEFDFEFIRFMFYLGLKHEDKDLTEEKTGEILDILCQEKGLEYVAEILTEAITKAFGIKETPAKSIQKNMLSH